VRPTAQPRPGLHDERRVREGGRPHPGRPGGRRHHGEGPFGNPAVSGAGFGSGNSLAFSADRGQEFLYLSAPPEITVFRRRTLEFLGSFAAGGTHGLTADQDGSIYTAGREKYELTGFVRLTRRRVSHPSTRLATCESHERRGGQARASDRPTIAASSPSFP
jgi:hypothetical protein